MNLSTRCQGCGARGLTLSFRGSRCLSCILMAPEDRGDDRDFDWDAAEPGERLEPVPRATGQRRGPRLIRTHASPQLVERVKRLRADGRNFCAIGRECGISRATARRWCLGLLA